MQSLVDDTASRLFQAPTVVVSSARWSRSSCIDVRMDVTF